MRRDLAALEAEEFDVAVVGGGMFGAAAALDAAQRGLKVALVERGDFCGATSAHSFKMIHGGIRYLQHADVRRIRQSARARSAFLRVAPHLAQPLPIVVPTYGNVMQSKAVLRAGMWGYDALTLDRNRGIRDPARRIPWSWFLSRDEVIQRYPGLYDQGLTGAGVFCDGQMYSPPRLVLAFVRSAVTAGAVCANYAEATRFIGDDQRITGVEVRDRLNGGRLKVRAKLVLNAAGPYAERLLATATGRPLAPPTPFSRDAYFLVARPLIEGDWALTVPSRTYDPDAIVSRGGRHLFLVPWRGTTLVGVWHKVYGGDPDRYEIAEAELSAWIDEINEAYPGLGLRLNDVALGSAGLVPFGENDPGARHLKFAHRSRLVDHARERGLQGLVTLIGVRYTTGPFDAAEVVDLVCTKLGYARGASRLDTTPVDGGDVADFAQLVEDIGGAPDMPTSPAIATALAHNHGSAWDRIHELCLARPDLARPLSGCEVLAAEVVLAVIDEMAVTLADVVFRRTDLCTAGPPSREALLDAARLTAEAAGWSAGRRAAELEFVEQRLKLARTGRALLADTAMPLLAEAA